MSLTTTSGASILAPEQINELIVKPLSQESVALRVFTVVPITGPSLRIRIVGTDVAAAWTAEGAEISATDEVISEIDVTPKKLAALTIISNELAADSSPAALNVVGQSIVRDLARKIDAAAFASATTNGPSGLLSISSTAVDAGDAWADFDWAEKAKSNAWLKNAEVTAFVCSPATAVTLSTLKQFTTAGSNVPLLQPDLTRPGAYVVSGVPLHVSPAVADDIVWGIPSSRVIVAMRQDVSLVTDTSAYFSSDRTGVRATLRLGIGFPDPSAISKVAPTPA